MDLVERLLTAVEAAGRTNRWREPTPGWEMSTSFWIPDRCLICRAQGWRRINVTWERVHRERFRPGEILAGAASISDDLAFE